MTKSEFVRRWVALARGCGALPSGMLGRRLWAALHQAADALLDRGTLKPAELEDFSTWWWGLEDAAHGMVLPSEVPDDAIDRFKRIQHLAQTTGQSVRYVQGTIDAVLRQP